MAKIYCDKEFNGISASVNFVDGIGITVDPYLISWFMEHGYKIFEDIREPSVYDLMSYKELTELAKERGFNGIGLKKEPLMRKFIDLDAKIEDDKITEMEE